MHLDKASSAFLVSAPIYQRELSRDNAHAHRGNRRFEAWRDTPLQSLWPSLRRALRRFGCGDGKVLINSRGRHETTASSR